MQGLLSAKRLRRATRLEQAALNLEAIKRLQAETHNQVITLLNVNKQLIEKLAQLGVKVVIKPTGLEYEAVKLNAPS